MKKLLVIFIISFGLLSCDDFLEQQPVDLITSDQLIIDGASATTAVFGLYSGLQGIYDNESVTHPGVLSDELDHSGSFPTIAEMDQNQVIATNVTSDNIWFQAYSTIFRANNVIENLAAKPDLTGLTDADRASLIAETRFVRALAYFNLTTLYGDVPLTETTDLTSNQVIGETSRADVYSYVISEAAAAATALAGIDFDSENQFRATEWAAKALGARANLYAGNVSAAATLADDVITNGGFALETNYEDIFVPSSSSNEIIFSIFFSIQDQSGLSFQFLPDGRFEFSVNQGLLDTGDPRVLSAVNGGDALGRSYVTKYSDISNGSDHTIVFRLAEMYLIRAEANIGSASAINDVNALRNRAGVATISNVTINTILDERFVELSFEGHRWYDLIRTGQVDAVMGAANPTNWQPTDALLPIPDREIRLNANLSQNPGY